MNKCQELFLAFKTFLKDFAVKTLRIGPETLSSPKEMLKSWCRKRAGKFSLLGGRQFMDHNDTTNATRAEVILQELLRTGEVSVNSLATRLKVTSATIRRDLTSLE